MTTAEERALVVELFPLSSLYFLSTPSHCYSYYCLLSFADIFIIMILANSY